MNTYDVFVEVVKQKSFSAAAKKLHRSPSAISKQIGLLEEKLNVKLVDRTTRSLAVTEAGQTYYERCLDISARIQEAEAELRDLSDEPRGTVNITWPPMISFSKATRVLSDLTFKYPKIHVNLSVDSSILNLTEENIDIAFRTGVLPDSQMISTMLFSMQPIFCATPEAISHFGFPETIDDLAKFPLITQNNIEIQKKARALNPDLKDLVTLEHHTTNDLVTNLELMKQGMGTTVVFKHMIEKELEQGSLVRVIPNIDIPAVPVHLLYQNLDYMPKKIRYFIDAFKAAFNAEAL
ncbi:MAG: hypothetical protein C9356_05860 [Oleiphilus sp.]|nr:MAG: hypothetical protein C9356_05860 [Oleiphilus sp.]